MARMASIVVPWCPHHATHRGDLRANVFWVDADRLLYKSLLAQSARQFGG
jgi:putative transposase